jgi:hypothetical protein
MLLNAPLIAFSSTTIFFAPEPHDQIGVAFANAVVLVLQVDHFLAFVPEFCEAQADLHGAVVNLLRETGAQEAGMLMNMLDTQ